MWAAELHVKAFVKLASYKIFASFSEKVASEQATYIFCLEHLLLRNAEKEVGDVREFSNKKKAF